ncbi:MAG: hypothetical protein U0132_23750 [Gemmatimonadaceae bacterium]
MRVAARVLGILLVALAIVVTVLLWLGPPTLAREYVVKSEVARFAPTIGHGLIQLGGESFLLAVVIYASRRWFRVRL